MRPFEGFVWDEPKREHNLRKHAIDFADAIAVFDGPHLVKRSSYSAEPRFVALGLLFELEIVVVYTVRKRKCRLISARRAHSRERDEYHEALRKRR